MVWKKRIGNSNKTIWTDTSRNKLILLSKHKHKPRFKTDKPVTVYEARVQNGLRNKGDYVGDLIAWSKKKSDVLAEVSKFKKTNRAIGKIFR